MRKTGYWLKNWSIAIDGKRRRDSDGDMKSRSVLNGRTRRQRLREGKGKQKPPGDSNGNRKSKRDSELQRKKGHPRRGKKQQPGRKQTMNAQRDRRRSSASKGKRL